MASHAKLTEALSANWKAEVVAARVYRALADVEPNARRKELFLRMAVSEEEHAELWAGRLADLGVIVDPATAEGDTANQMRLVRLLGVNAMIDRIEREELGHVDEYADQIIELNDPDSTAILEKVMPDEQAHAERLREMAHEAQRSPRGRLDSLLSREKWHVGGAGNWIGDAIYGINDGLGAVFGIVSAVAGATHASSSAVLIAGMAGMIGSAFSMGSSAYLAAKSEREVHEAEILREKMEIETDPEHEREELELMYQIKGFNEEEARFMATRVSESPEAFLSTMVREELGIAEERLPKPWTSAFSATLSTAIGAILPILPFLPIFHLNGTPAILWALAISVVAHFAVGASKTFITGRSWLAQGFEMTFVALLGGALAYGFGLLLGAHGGF